MSGFASLLTLRVARAAACGIVALLLCALAPLAAAQQQGAPVVHGIDHVAFTVTDLQRSLAFYQRVFGSEVWRQRGDDRHYLPLGMAYLALTAHDSADIDYLALGINGFDSTALQRWLRYQQLQWQQLPEVDGLQVSDRDGTQLRLVADHGRERLARSGAAPQPDWPAMSGLFHPLALDEVYISVSNLEVDALHYARLLGHTGTLQAGSLWFNLGGARLRLSQAPVGQAPGVNYFAVLVSQTDMDAAANAVFAAGGIIETIVPNGFSFWDPDGIRVLVRTAGQF